MKDNYNILFTVYKLRIKLLNIILLKKKKIILRIVSIVIYKQQFNIFS